MTNSKYDVMNDVKKTKSDDFLTNLSKEKERQNNAIGVSSGSSSSKTNSGNYYVFSADGNTKSEPKTSKVQEPLIYYNQKPEHVIEREKNYVTNRYNVEKQNPSDETKVLQTNLNSYGYVGKDNKPLNVDSAYGENTNYAFNNAWRNNEQVIKNREIVQKRDIIEPMLNAIYEPMKEKANSRKHNASKDEITQIQNMLINEGHTDWNGNPLNVTGEFDEKTLGGYEKYIQETTPKQEVYNMQKELNALEITDVYGNAIKQDGLLGPITDGTVQNFIHQANNITSEELEPVRGDTEKTKADYSQLRKNFAYYNTLAEPYNAYATNVNVAPEVAALKFENPIVQNKRTEGYGNQNIADANALLSMNPLASNKKNKSSQDFIPKAITEIVESQKNTNQYPNDTVHLNDYFWKSGYKTADIEGAKDVLSSQKGVYLKDNGDIDDNTAVAIVNYAKANNLTLEQASDRLVELGKIYNEVEKRGFKSNEIEQIQIKLNQLGIRGEDGNALSKDNLLGKNTLSAIKELSERYKIPAKDTINILLNKSQNYPEDVNEITASYDDIYIDAESACELGIITEIEKNIVIKEVLEKQFDIKAEFIKSGYNEKIVDKITSFNERILEFAIFDYWLSDIDGGIVYAYSDAEYILKKMYSEADNVVNILQTSMPKVHSTRKGRNIKNFHINKENWRIDLVYPQGSKKAELHFQNKAFPDMDPIKIHSIDDLKKLPKSVRNNSQVIEETSKALKKLAKLLF